MNFVRSKYFLTWRKIGYITSRDISISSAWYFNQLLLKFNKYFASDADYIIFTKSLYHQHLSLSTNFTMNKIKPGTLTVETLEMILKEQWKRAAHGSTFFFMSLVKGKPAYWKQFLYDVLAVVKQLGIPTYFLTFTCGDLRWEELPYINKLDSD